MTVKMKTRDGKTVRADTKRSLPFSAEEERWKSFFSEDQQEDLEWRTRIRAVEEE